MFIGDRAPWPRSVFTASSQPPRLIVRAREQLYDRKTKQPVDTIIFQNNTYDTRDTHPTAAHNNNEKIVRSVFKKKTELLQ